MAEKRFVSYGLRELQVASLVSDNPPKAEYADLVRLYGAKTASASLTFVSSELTGDDGTVESDSNISNVEVSFENGIMTFESIRVITGGNIQEIKDKEGNVVGGRLSIKGGQSLPYFGLAGKTEKDGTMKFILPKVKLSSLEFSFAEQDYCLVSGGGMAVKSMASEELYYMDKLEAANVPLTIEDFQPVENTEAPEV